MEPFFMIYLVAGTRPNFMTIAPIWQALFNRKLPTRILHTDQHFDASIDKVFFKEVGLPKPDLTLKAGGGSHAEVTAAVLVGTEADLLANRPHVVVVVGDVTSTLAAALAASKLRIPVVHVEAGLRSRDWAMPEEINRVLTDQLADLLLIPSHDARSNLLAEGIAPERIVFVGNVMIDSLHHTVAHPTDAIIRFNLKHEKFALVTLDDPTHVENEEAFTKTLDAIEAIAKHLTVLFPMHPRTLARAKSFGLSERMQSMKNLRLIEPLGHADFVTLMSRATLVATDSGSIQDETTALGIPCLTMRQATERPITITEGTNTIVGLDADFIRREVEAIMAGCHKRGRIPEGWDGKTGERIVAAIEALLAGTPRAKAAGPRA
jgi:UDP-N-acetylglucosamine 2-epimerase (non-hydrolysing)